MTYYLSLGSNLGEREQTLRQALELIAQQIGVISACSDRFYSAPWGYESANPFCNLCCCVETKLEPQQMLQATQAIERQLGRDHKTVNGQYTDRTIDIDLIRAFDENGHEICYKSGTLTIPHPLWEQREFVRVPLEQIVTTNIN